jgi:hypothetical protein
LSDPVPNQEDLVARLLQFLADDPGRMARFFNVTGLTATTIRAAASAPGFTASILDYVLEDEPLLRVFAAEAEIAPGELLRARVGLESRGNAAPQEERKPAAPLGASNLARRFGVE